VTDLPPAVRRYVDRANAAEPAQRVRVTQVGEMWLKPGGWALRFDAVEDFAVAEVAFEWRARFRPMGCLRVVDRYAAGEGLLEARLLGLLPVMRQTGPELAVGEALRYLAELVWAPHAMVANEHLEWRELDDRHVEVATRVGSTRAAVRLELDAEGDVVGARVDDRPRAEGKRVLPRPWVGSFDDYAVVDGIRMPTRGEVRWELPEGPFTYWRGTIRSVEVTPKDEAGLGRSADAVPPERA
jgi:hypothetical protein